MDNKTEDYLDSLLSNISPEHKRQVQEKKSSDYMADFEKELEHMDMEEFVQDFEREIDREEGAEEGTSEQEFFDNLEDIVEGAQKPETDSGAEEKSQDEESFEVNTMEDDDWTQSEGEDKQDTDSQETAAAQEEGAAEVESAAENESAPKSDDRTEEEKDLMQLLSEVSDNDEELSGIENLLNADENNESVEESSGDTEVSLSDIAGDEDEDASGDGKKKRKKKKEKREGETFLQRISRILFGEDDEEEIEGGKRSVADALEGQELGSVSDENLQILQELDSVGQGGDGSAEENKKDKKKKKKKEKKPKPKKQKKPKEKKPPKPKKPKKPKEVDLSPPLPRGPVILIFVMGASLILFIMLSANLINYKNDVNAATASFKSTDYVKAYQVLEGMKLKEGDQELYQKTLVLAQVQSEYLAGESLYLAGQYRKALDSYICALGRYDINYEKAVECDAEKEFSALEDFIVLMLDERFEVSPETAREIYALHNRKEYTKRIYDIVKNLGLLEEVEE
ncbi:MAG: hypothetical protein NC307_06815 [Roseburia sp.]|nr:hypothetical protein [Roseburia sp.]